MGYERNYRDRNRDNDGDYGRDTYGAGRDAYGSARDYFGGDNGRYEGGRQDGGRYESGRYEGGRGDNRFDQRATGNYGGNYGSGSYGGAGYGDSYGQQRDYGYGRADQSREYGQRDYGQRDYGQRDYGQRGGYGRGAYGGAQGYGRDPRQGYDADDRGFFARAGDEVRSWFGDEEAERRREADQRYDERNAAATDRDYGNWRRGQIDALDRDYDEYRRENQTKFQNEFSSWRSERQTQRSSLDKVSEHMEVVGSDGQHVGTVDKVRGDKIILTKTDQDAGGHHHSIPSRWIQTVDDKVTIRKTADEAKQEWKDVERRTALFGDDDRTGTSGPHALNRSFSGTYR